MIKNTINAINKLKNEGLLKDYSISIKHRSKNLLTVNKLKNMKCFRPGGAFYAFPNVSKSNLTGEKFSEVALNNFGVALVPGTSFGDSAKMYIRLSYANSLENIEKAINRLSKI